MKIFSYINFRGVENRLRQIGRFSAYMCRSPSESIPFSARVWVGIYIYKYIPPYCRRLTGVEK